MVRSGLLERIFLLPFSESEGCYVTSIMLTGVACWRWMELVFYYRRVEWLDAAIHYAHVQLS